MSDWVIFGFGFFISFLVAAGLLLPFAGIALVDKNKSDLSEKL